MANIIVVNEKNAGRVFEKHDPYIWKCDACGKERKYTQEEIDKKKKPHPDPQNYERDYYISCPFCATGEMEPPLFIFFGGFLEDLTNE